MEFISFSVENQKVNDGLKFFGEHQNNINAILYLILLSLRFFFVNFLLLIQIQCRNIMRNDNTDNFHYIEFFHEILKAMNNTKILFKITIQFQHNSMTF